MPHGDVKRLLMSFAASALTPPLPELRLFRRIENDTISFHVKSICPRKLTLHIFTSSWCVCCVWSNVELLVLFDMRCGGRRRRPGWFSRVGQFTQIGHILGGGGGHFCGRVARLATSQDLVHLPP